jgi:hypothetical protein
MSLTEICGAFCFGLNSGSVSLSYIDSAVKNQLTYRQIEEKEDQFNMPNKSILMGILAIVAGILVLIFPDSIRWVVGIFLIVWGVLAIAGKS